MSARRARNDRGMVSAEFAAAMPAVALIVALACSVLGFVVDEIRCLDAARAAARSASRGDPVRESRKVAQQLAPSDATVAISGRDVVTVVVSAPARRIGGRLPASFDARASASMPRERPR